MTLIFWDVDTQYDFMHADGRLYVPGAEEIIPNLARLTAHAHASQVRIVASADDHEPSHAEISERPDFTETFPPHCMRGTPGQQKIPETALVNPVVIEPRRQDEAALRERVAKHSGDILFHKYRFDVFSNPNVAPVVELLDPTDVVLYGVALDVCDRYAVDGLLDRRPQTRISLVTDATKAIAPDRVASLLEGWTRRGVRLITTDDALRLSPGETERGRPA